jgi:predicted metal-binding membrane protein
MIDGAAERRHDRAIVIALLAAVAALAWTYTIHQAREMNAMDAAMWRDMNMTINGMTPSWTAIDVALLLAMWMVMMAAMMLPGSAPVVAAFAAINRRRRERGAPYVPTVIFLAGYLTMWALFSAGAVLLQWALQLGGLLTTMMQSGSLWLSAALFLAAGLYQFSPLKRRCLDYCRSPDGFILSEWRDGALGALVMGWRHGLFCLGCCFALMLLLFAVAVMDLRWVAVLTVLVTAEKLLPGARIWRASIGIVLILSSIGLFVAAGVGA